MTSKEAMLFLREVAVRWYTTGLASDQSEPFDTLFSKELSKKE